MCRGRLLRPTAVARRGLRRAGRRADRRRARRRDEGVVRLATGGELHADAVVIAAGVDTPRLLPELPIRPEARYLFFSDPMRERLLEPLVVSPEHRFAAKQLGDGRLLASDLGAVGDPAVDLDRWRANVRRAFEDLLPQLVFVPLPALVEGMYDVTPDHQAILGRVRDRVWVAAGFSGHGFMLAPAVGRIIAEAVDRRTRGSRVGRARSGALRRRTARAGAADRLVGCNRRTKPGQHL